MEPDHQGTEDYLFQLMSDPYSLEQAYRVLRDYFSETNTEVGRRILIAVPPTLVAEGRVHAGEIGYEIRVHYASIDA